MIENTEKFRKDYMHNVKDLLEPPKELSDNHETVSSSGENSDREETTNSPGLGSSFALSSKNPSSPN
jgi:hypothetical protein